MLYQVEAPVSAVRLCVPSRSDDSIPETELYSDDESMWLLLSVTLEEFIYLVVETGMELSVPGSGDKQSPELHSQSVAFMDMFMNTDAEVFA